MRIQATALEQIVERTFTAAGCAPDEASCVARHLVSSNLAGHDSHGVIRVSRYVGFMRDGEVQPGARMTVAFESDTAAVIDGNMGFGQVIGEQAMDLLADKAKSTGLALRQSATAPTSAVSATGPSSWPSTAWSRSTS